MTQTASRNGLALPLLALINARLSALANPSAAYEADETRSLKGDYVVLRLIRTDGGNQRVGPHIAPSMWIAEVEAVGPYVTNVGVLLDECTTALEHQSVTVSGVESTPLKFESESHVREDYPTKSLLSADRTFTFAF